MKRRDLEKHLKANGCSSFREGGNHTIWINLATSSRTPVNRHNEIPAGTCRSICRKLGVKPPSNLA